jgi:hypothetical protein
VDVLACDIELRAKQVPVATKRCEAALARPSGSNQRFRWPQRWLREYPGLSETPKVAIRADLSNGVPRTRVSLKTPKMRAKRQECGDTTGRY